MLKPNAGTLAESTELSLYERAVGAYIGLAIGDALGATTEFMTPREIQEKHGTHNHIIGGGWLKLKTGQVTDDTDMSLALGQSILDNNGVDPKAVAEAFSNWMRSKPIDCGNTVRRGIIHYRTSGETSVPLNEFDAGNGACMRALPIALAYHNAPEDEVRRVCRLQSHVTHNNPVSDAGTETIVLMVIATLKGATKDDLFQLVNDLVAEHRSFRFDKRRVENPSGWIVETLQVVFQAFFAKDTLEAAVVDVVNRGGDADTTGAIAGMLCGAYYGAGAVPRQWRRALACDVKAACEEQAARLMSLAS
ncbi:MAG: ADP-ribosyl-[dinitrogen reductase] hydrolase [Candidatus Sedimenticola endophacoides]